MSYIPNPTAPPVTRLDSNVTQEPSDKWAENTKSAILDNSEVHSSTVPGATGPILGGNKTGLDTVAKSQQDIDNTLGNATAESTPGREFPGAWTDQPASAATQVYNDVSNVLAQAGQVAYDAIPEGVKGAFSTQPTSTSPIATTTNTHSSPTTGATVTETVSNAANTAKSALASAYDKTVDTYNNTSLSSTLDPTGLPGGRTTLSDEQGETAPYHQINTLPSQDKQGALPGTRLGPVGGVGALPGAINETSVAVLPEERALGQYNNEPADTAYAMTTHPDSATSHPPTTSPSNQLSNTATAAAATLTGAAATAAATVSSYIPGLSGAQSDNGTSLPSQETKGAEPGGRGIHPVGGVGALPGPNNESSVALLPHEKANPNPLSTASAEFATGKQNARLASPYDSESPYSDVKANTVDPPLSHPSKTSNIHSSELATGDVSTKDKIESKAAAAVDKVKDKAPPGHDTSSEEAAQGHVNKSPANGKSSAVDPPSSHAAGASDKDKALPRHPASSDAEPRGSGDRSSLSEESTTGKKAGFMDKVKGEAKVLSGKISRNEEKVEQGRALKTGTASATQ